MAGRGPAPKEPDRRARANKPGTPQTVLRYSHAPQPPLPALSDDAGWHPQTRAWWAMWGESAQAELLTASDWAFLLDTAILHSAMWNGNLGLAGEVRLRVAKFGSTPEDRARLRMVFADADEKDEKRGAQGSDGPGSAKERYGQLRVMPSRPAGESP